MKELLNKIIEKLFEKKIPKVRYIEKRIEIDTECDNCEYLEKCKAESIVVERTSYEDTREHYIKSRCCICVKGCEEFLEMKLSEFFKIADTEDMKEFIQKAIDQLGDITYKEFYQDGKFLDMNL